MNESIEDFLKDAELKFGPQQPFQPNVWIRADIGVIDITLEDVACYHEWIKGEGADISIWRAMNDNRVVGATLPLRNWKGTLPVDISESL